MKKTIAMTLIILTLCVSFALPSYAALPETDTVMPLWDNISSVYSDIGFGADGIASATGSLVRKTGVELTEGTMTVYKNVGGEWVYLTSAYNSATRGTLAVNADFAYESGVEYKSVFNATAYRNGVPESIEKTEYRTAPTLA